MLKIPPPCGARKLRLKLWDCDSYEVISTLAGHATEILAMALSQADGWVRPSGVIRRVFFRKSSGEDVFNEDLVGFSMSII